MAVTWKKLAQEDDVITKATFTTKGDVLVTTGASTPIRLAVGTNTHVLTADSGEASGVKWAAAAGGAATKEFFIPVTAAHNFAAIALGSRGSFPAAVLNAADEEAFISFHIPSDFSSITEAVIVALWDATHADTDLDIYSDYGANGEAYNTNSESDTASVYSFTANELTEIDISDILSSRAASDYVGIKLILSTDPGDNLFILGVRFKYA